MKTVVVEGWRCSSHSYALVNQHQLLWMLLDTRMRVSHTDVEFYRPHWQQLSSGLSAEDRLRLQAIPGRSDAHVDRIYRISFPLRLQSGEAERIFVFGTSEYRNIEPHMYSCGEQGLKGSNVDALEFVTPSNWSRAGFLSFGVAPERIHVVPHGVRAEICGRVAVERRLHLRRLMGFPEDSFVFLSIGSATWNKGIGPLVAAFARLRTVTSNAILMLKCSEQLYGPQIESSYSEAVRLNGASLSTEVLASIRYNGENISQSQLAALYQACDAYVSPYRAEGFNLPVLEALGAGLPAVVTRGGSTDDFCPDSFSLKIDAELRPLATGGSCLEPDIRSLLSCMQQAMEDEAFRCRVADQAPRWVAENYSWDRVTQRLSDLMLEG